MQGKTFLVAVFCVVRCILYPGTKICVCSKSRKQANETLEKITTILMPNSANLRAEIEKTVVTGADAYIKFKNGSHIKVVTATDNGRGARANILIVDEFRLVDMTILNTVLRKFLTAPRQPKYLNNPKYANLTERNKEIYMSSAWFKSHPSYAKMVSFANNLVNSEKKYFVCGLPYQLAIKENLLSAEQVADEMSEQDFNEITFYVEMCALWFDDKDGNFFNYTDVSKNRILKNAVYPILPSGLSIDKKTKIPELANGERRILSADIALLASRKQNNDASSIIINSALPTSSNRYISNIIYLENFEGLHTNDLALIIRRLYEIYHCTDLCIDCKGVGLGTYDCLVREIYDPEYGVTYSPLNCCNDPTFAERCQDKNAPKVIWAISANSTFNNEMYLNLRERLRQNRVNLLVSELDTDDIFKNIKGYNNILPEDKVKLQLPYIQTTLLINELINLDYESQNGNIKVHEKSGMRKDRVSSIGYNLWVVSQLEQRLKNKNNSFEEGLKISSLCRRPSIAK